MKNNKCSLKKFDILYNKFIYEWSNGSDLKDISSSFKNTDFSSYEEEPITTSEIEPDTIEITVNDLPETDNKTQCAKNCFYNQFPKYLLTKCKNKFPLDDNTEIPTEIVDEFWDAFSEKILNNIADISINILSKAFYDVLISTFGKDTEYNENDTFLNNAALKLVKQLE